MGADFSLFEFFIDHKNLLLGHLPQPAHIGHTGDLNQTGISCQKSDKIVEAVVQQLKIKTLQQQLLLVKYSGGLKSVFRGQILPGPFNKIQYRLVCFNAPGWDGRTEHQSLKSFATA